ncbi:MAG: phosphatase PAP2 family protein [Gemmatimonadales bacterium]
MGVAVGSGEHIGAGSLRDRLLPVDWLLLGYLAIVTVVAIIRAPRQPSCWWLLPAHALFVLLVLLLRRANVGPVGRMLGEIYPLLLLVGLYGEIGILNGGGVPVHDALVQRWEAALFGGQVSTEWWRAAPSRFWSAVLHAAYFSYYLIVTVPAIVFLRRGQRAEARNFVFAVMVTFVTCYLVFLFFPVAGPYYAFPHPPAWFIDNPPARLVYATLAAGSSYGAAFPSSHVAAAAAATVAAFRGSRRVGLALVVPTLLLMVGVVYCQMHYGVDALAGAAVGLVWGQVTLSSPMKRGTFPHWEDPS